ncbi:MAG: hypothetical protein LVQ63_01110 [Thermoplasmatales archaeon]|nr:hypothetical protein [Thermoplasmatales archaeon]
MKEFRALVVTTLILALAISSAATVVVHAQIQNSSKPGYLDSSSLSTSVTAYAESQSNSLTLSPGGAVYLYAAVTGGGQPISSESYITDLFVSDSNPYITGPVIAIGHSSNNTGNFSTAGAYYAIGGARVTSLIYENYTFFNDSTGANSTTGTFSVQYNGSLVVIVSAASNSYNGSVTSNAPFTYDAFTRGTYGNAGSYAGIVIASAFVNSGQYSFTVNYATGPGDSYASSVGAVVYVFSQVSAREYNVTFSESGLPSGSTWYVNLSNGLSYSSTTSTISFQAYNGTYYYSVSSNTVYSAFPSSGSFTVNGGNIEESVTFTLVHYSVTFIESGLPTGTVWYITLGGLTEDSSNTTLTFSEVNGKYDFEVGKLTGYISTPSTGVINVNSENVTDSISFTAEKYSVSFVEVGLPSGTLWSVNLNGNVQSSPYSNITFSVYDGNYPYSVPSVNGFTPSPQNGTVNVNGNNLTVLITFKSYTITFRETGLPPGASWEISVNGVSESSSNDSIILKEGNGTYTFSVANITGYRISQAIGKVSVSGRNVSVLVTFSFVSPAGMSPYYSPVMEIAFSFVLFVVLTLAIIMLRRGEGNEP